MDSQEGPVVTDINTSEYSTQHWHWFGKKLPRAEIVFFSQIIILYLIIITAVVNLSFGSGNDKLWIALLSSSIGYALPNPSIKKKKT